MKACETCRYAKLNWRKGDKYFQRVIGEGEREVERTETSYQCRRNPPALGNHEGQNDGWPWVVADDWCGEHSPREGE